jgi:hypothetical protein
MKFTLRRLTERFIITSDEEIKEGDLSIMTNDFNDAYLVDIIKYLKQNKEFEVRLKKSPFNLNTCKEDKLKKVIAQQDQIDFSALSEEEQKEIGWVDIDFIVKDICGYDKNIPLPKNDNEVNIALDCLKRFQKSQELLSDRKFTLKDMKKAYIQGMENQTISMQGETYSLDFETLIQSLSNSSWKVELEMETVIADYEPAGCDFPDYIEIPKFTNGKVKILKIL